MSRLGRTFIFIKEAWDNFLNVYPKYDYMEYYRKIKTYISKEGDNLSYCYIPYSYIVEEMEKKTKYGFDERGIPLTLYSDGSRIHNPVSVANYALGLWEMYLHTDDKLYLDKFKNLAHWFLTHFKKTEIDGKSAIVWEYKLSIPYYRIKNSFISAMAQGVAISVLLRYYTLNENKKILSICKQAAEVFSHSVKVGGVISKDENNNIWFEECASKEGISSHILNGHIFAGYGILDLYRITKDPNYLDLWNDCVKTVKNTLEDFDLGYWAGYDLLYKKPVDPKYMVHVYLPQLLSLYYIEKDTVFKKYFKKWERYMVSKGNRIHVIVSFLFCLTYIKLSSFIWKLKVKNNAR